MNTRATRLTAAITAGTILISSFCNSLYADEPDWAFYGKYAGENKTLIEEGKAGHIKAVLYGDSITEGWARQDAKFLSDNNLVGRGISGQTTTQILARMNQDVVSLRPEYVVILCGINDIAKNGGCAPDVERAVGNIKSMCEIALANKIKPIVCALLPSYKVGWRPACGDIRPQVEKFNSLLKEYAKTRKISYADYWTLFADKDGKMPEKYSNDSIHPNIEGYKIMEEYILCFIRK